MSTAAPRWQRSLRTACGIGTGLSTMVAWHTFQPREVQELWASPALTWAMGGLIFRCVAPHTKWPGFILGMAVMGTGWSSWAVYLPIFRTLSAIKEQTHLSDHEKATLQKEMAHWRDLRGSVVLDEQRFQALTSLLKESFFALAKKDSESGRVWIFRDDLDGLMESVQTKYEDGLRSRLKSDTTRERVANDLATLQLAIKIFSAMDLDDEGRVSWQGFISGWLIVLATEVTEPKLRAALWFHALDLDQDGQISRPELLYWAKVLCRLGRISNMDAIVQDRVFYAPRPATLEEVVDTWLERCNLNHNDKAISKRDFIDLSLHVDVSPWEDVQDAPPYENVHQQAESCPADPHSDEPRSRKRWRVALDRLPGLISELQPLSLESPTETGVNPGRVDRNRVKARLIAALPPKLAEALRPVNSVLVSSLAHVEATKLSKALLGIGAILAHDTWERHKCRQSGAPAGAEHAPLLEDALRYMRMSSAAYGLACVNPAMFPEARMSRDLLENPDIIIYDHAGLDAGSVRVVHSKPRASWLSPAHYVVHDAERKEAVVVVRGTLSLEDVVTDLGGESVNLFVGGMAHQNILQSASTVLRSVAPALEELAGSVDQITFAGHSLGGGVSVYLSLLFRELVDPNAAESGLSVKCFSFGAPGTCSLDVARSLQPNIVSICHADDIVPRLSFGHILELHDRVVASGEGASPSRQIPFPQHEHRKLFSAGRCFLVQPDGTLKETDPEELAPYIRLGGGARVVADHLPPNYEKALRAALVSSKQHRVFAVPVQEEP